MPGIKPGVAVPLYDGVVRWTAPNPGFMTGEGTNAYILGTHKLTLIDPGPVIDSNIAALIDYCDGRLERVVVTHTHRDHCPAAMAIAGATGVPVYGSLPPSGEENDAGFLPDVMLQEGQRIVCDYLNMDVLHTPGHASNHYCFLVREASLLLTGDHIMNGSTVVIAAPDGNMAAYLRSLSRLQDMGFAAIGPGHGDLIHDPVENINGIIAHRLARERKVLSALQAVSPCTVDELLPHAYDDVDARLLPVARYSLCAHVEKLLDEGVIDEMDSRLQATP
ncbi:MAG: MBL fold metallo-hydrolase [Pseudomonadota bacterium]